MDLSALEDCIQLNLPAVDVDLDSLQWVQYNPRKAIGRWGASLTSLDGGMSGTPDLDSVYEFNQLKGTQYREVDFKVWTPQSKPFRFMGDLFEIGRSHIIRLDAGGYFPYHRDADKDTFRLLYCIRNCNPLNMVWIQDRMTLAFEDRRWYYINTKKSHAVFSFQGCEFAVFNVVNGLRSHESLYNSMVIR